MLRRADRRERRDHPFTGFKLARAVLSADGAHAGFAGLSIGAGRVYGVTADASCVWNSRHAPPRQQCGCGFYCLATLDEARALACADGQRTALLLEVAASGRFIRYERGLRYSRQRVRAIRSCPCRCGRPADVLIDSGRGLVGWRHLAVACRACAAGRPSVTLGEFAERLDGPVSVDADPAAAAGPLPAAVLTAEIALLQARLDDLQARVAHLYDQPGGA